MKILSGVLALVLLLAGAVWWVDSIEPEAPVTVDNPRVRLVPGGGPMAGYFEIHNHTDQPVRLAGADSGAFGRVAIHRTTISEGQARMQHQPDGVVIQAGGSAVFEPGGLHLMLMQPSISPEVGEQVDIVLHFEANHASVPEELHVSFTLVPVTAS